MDTKMFCNWIAFHSSRKHLPFRWHKYS